MKPITLAVANDEPLVVYEAADNAAKDFIAERIEHMIAHLEYAHRVATLTGDNVPLLQETLKRAGLEFKAVRETMEDIMARRRDGSRDKVPAA